VPKLICPKHFRSKIHQGSNSTCPFCKRGFTTYTGLSHHLEAGSCPNARNVNRENVYKFVRSRDENHVITTKQIGWHIGVDNVVYEASSRAFNGYSWECYLCHRTFGSNTALNQHLNSPAHKSNLYRCPNRGCGNEFKTLAALFNHLESESCGFMRFSDVEKAGNMMFHNKRIAF
jgi:C2H2-type zinc finger protein